MSTSTTRGAESYGLEVAEALSIDLARAYKTLMVGAAVAYAPHPSPFDPR